MKSKKISNDPCLTLKYLMTRSNLVPCNFVWEKVKTIDFSETVVIKVGRRSKLNEYVNLYEYQRSRSFIDLGQISLRFNIFKPLFLRNRWAAMHMYSKKSPCLEPKGPITLKLGMQYRLIDYYQIYSNDETGMTLVPTKVGRCSQTTWVHEALWISKVKVIHWPSSKVTHVQHF